MVKDLEYHMIEQLKAGQCSVERALLVVSGLQNEEEVAEYQRKLDRMQKGFEKFNNGLFRKIKEALFGNGQCQEYGAAKALFEYLWETKPNRYNGDFLLAKVIDNQLDNGEGKVGNCAGLTSLYSVLGVRLGLDVAVLYNGNHVLSLLSCHGQEIVVENNKRNGFDCNFEERPKFQKEDLRTLVSSVFYSRGSARYNLGDFKGSIQDYDKVLEIEPDYASAFNNRIIAIKMLEKKTNP